jgi:hypothetical protein
MTALYKHLTEKELALRDEFAMKVLESFLPRYPVITGPCVTVMVRQAYVLANAMMIERKEA